jgi:translocation and assembly module TamB
MQSTPQRRPQSWAPHHRWHVLYAAISTAFLGLLVFAVLYAYVASGGFSARIQNAVVSALEQATGGRVEIQGLRWSAWHLRVQVDGLTIHGLEAADQVPYLHVDHMEIDAKVLSFLSPRVGLARLYLDHPVFHLIVAPDGSTNQPHPKRQAQGASPVQTLFDLAVDHTRVVDGLLLINDRAVPWELAAGKLGLSMRYVTVSGHYQASLAVRDFTFRLQNARQAHSSLLAEIDISQKAARITHMEWATATSKLIVTGVLQDYAHPDWNATAVGQVDMQEAAAVTGYDPLRSGTAAVNLNAAGREGGVFLVDGQVSVQQGAFQAPWLVLQHVALRTHLHIDNTTMLFSQVASVLDGQGHVDGTLQLTHWMGAPVAPPVPVPQKKHWFSPKKMPVVAPRPQPLQALLEATVTDLPSPQILAAVAPSRFGDIGFTAEVTGPVRATWHGPGDALDVHGDLTLRPERHARPGSVPVSGAVKADYLGDTERLVFQQANLTTPGTVVHASGTLTLLDKDLHSDMRGTVTSQDLQEFDRLIYVVFDTTPASSAAEVRGPSFANHSMLPVHLEGSAFFRGQFTGSLLEPQLDGHLDAQRFVTQMGGLGVGNAPSATARTIHTLQWDSLHTDVSYAPSQVQVRHAVMARGATILHADAQLRLTPLGKDEYTVDTHSALVANARLANASITDLQTIVGTSYSATGTVSANIQLHGTMEDLSGRGNVTMTDVDVYGQPIPLAAFQVGIAGHQVQVQQLRIRAAGGVAEGGFSYDYLTHAIQGGLTGKQLDLKQVHYLQSNQAQVGGIGSIHLQAAGTSLVPLVTSSAVLDNVTVNGQPMGQVHAEGNLQGETLFLTSRAQLLQTRLELGGQMQMTPGLPAQLQLQFTDFDIGPVLQIFTHSSITGKSAIRGTMQCNGPLQHPRQVQVTASLDRFSVSINHVPLETDGPVRFSVRNGLLELLPVHITGTDTDLRMQGTADLLDGQRIRAHAEGGVNAALARTFSDSLTSSGHIDFSLDADGAMHQPRLTGRVQVSNLELHLQDVTNGLSAVNGTLAFDRDRLVIRQLSGYTGGGKVDFTGFASFHDGLYLDVGAKAKDIRIRYPRGTTSTADANLHLEGAPDALLLRGKVQLTRFAVSGNLDMAALAAAGQSASAPPDPTSALNRVRLDLLLTSSPQLGFQNSIATLAGDVDLHIRGTAASPSVLGRIDITQGKATFAGTQYTLQRGDILFTNPVTIEPELNLQATARVRDYDIMIGLNGTANKLQVNYRSEPPLSQADVLALLALGRTNEEAAMYGEQEQVGSNPTTEALLGGALNAAVSSRVQQLFGVASVRVDPNFVGVLGQSTARVTVEQQVGRNVTLVFATNVNTTAQQLLQAQYDITRNLSIIAVRDEADVFSLYFQIRGKRR